MIKKPIDVSEPQVTGRLRPPARCALGRCRLTRRDATRPDPASRRQAVLLTRSARGSRATAGSARRAAVVFVPALSTPRAREAYYRLCPDVVSSATFYKWKAKYGGLEVSDAKRLKALEDENAKLKKLLAEAMLDNDMLKDVASKKW